MKFNVSFRLEQRKDKDGILIEKNVPVFADITFNSQRLWYYTGYRVYRANFDNEKQQARKNSSGKQGTRTASYSEINRRLDRIKSELEIFFQDTKKPTKQQVIELLDDVCKKAEKQPVQRDFFTMFNSYIDHSDFSPLRKKGVGTTLNHWQEFSKTNNFQPNFENITPEILSKFRDYIKDGRSRNTVHKQLSTTRAFWNHAIKIFRSEGTEIPYPFRDFKLTGETYGEPIFLTSDERNKLFFADLESERLKRVRDVFVFQCLTGCRVGDLVQLTKSNVHNNQLTYIPGKTAKKTPKPVTIPLHDHAIEIIKRYDQPDGKLLPFITGQKYNVYLKELFESVNLTRPVQRLDTATGKTEIIPISEIASSHIARRTFVGNLFGKVDRDVISSMSGHTPNSRAFARYYTVQDEHKKQAINKL